MPGSMDGLIDKRMDGKMNGWMDRWDGKMDGWMVGRRDEARRGIGPRWMDRQKHGQNRAPVG